MSLCAESTLRSVNPWHLDKKRERENAKFFVLDGALEKRILNKLIRVFPEPRSDPQVILDVQQFSPDEITVKTVDNHVTVEAKHEEKQDEHGYVSRHFVRRYVLPSSHDLVNVTSTLSSDGVLTITAPKKVRSTEPRPALTSTLLSHSRRPRTNKSFSTSSSPSTPLSLPLSLSSLLAAIAYVTCLIFLPFNSNVPNAVRASECGIRRGQTVLTGFRSQTTNLH